MRFASEPPLTTRINLSGPPFPLPMKKEEVRASREQSCDANFFRVEHFSVANRGRCFALILQATLLPAPRADQVVFHPLCAGMSLFVGVIAFFR